jgi:Cu-processing system ATP-binding protein
VQEQLAKMLPVELHEVSKSYGSAAVLGNVSLSLAAGESLVLVGHNGAGKTTLMKLLLGLVRPSSGQVRVFGGDPATTAQRGALGYLPESISFDEAMTGRELLNFYARLKGVNGSSCDELLARVGIAEAADRRLSTWSKGMRQRLGLAQAILGHPRLLLLDEPTSGLDPSLRSTLYETIETLRAEGVTVLISSHALNEVEEHADRIAILQQGKLLACGTLAELSEQVALPVEIQISCASDATEELVDSLYTRLCGQLAGSPGAGSGAGINVRRIDNLHIALVCPHAGKMTALRQITDLGDAIVDINIRTPRLDEIYAHFMAGDKPQ